jgi:phage/plasmid-associated DNA primase
MPLPGVVEEDTGKWRAKTDRVVGFLADCTEFDRDAFTPGADMLKAFNAWLETEGNRPWNAKTLGDRFGGHDMVKSAKVEQAKKYVDAGGARKQVRGWAGVKLTTTPNPFS